MRAVIAFVIGVVFGYVLAQRPAKPTAKQAARFIYAAPTWTMQRDGTWIGP